MKEQTDGHEEKKEKDRWSQECAMNFANSNINTQALFPLVGVGYVDPLLPCALLQTKSPIHTFTMKEICTLKMLSL